MAIFLIFLVFGGGRERPEEDFDDEAAAEGGGREKLDFFAGAGRLVVKDEALEGDGVGCRVSLSLPASLSLP